MKRLLSSLYKYIPFKQQAFLILKKIWSPPHNIYQHLHFKGIINVKVDESHSFKMKHYGFELENEIFWKGLQNGWEKISINLWLKLIKNANVIIDIGANTGIYALLAKCFKPNATVFAFEPLPWIADKLAENCALNNYDIKIYESAVSDYDGKAKVYVEKAAAHVYSVTVNKNMLENNAGIEEEIKTITMQTVIEENHLIDIDLMKIDVETHEVEVLKGMGNYLETMKPTMLIEILNDEVGGGVQQLLDGKGYLYFNIDEKTGIRKVDRITKSDYYNYLVCSTEVAKQLQLL
ncbi:MAG: FkbM family methyltransferase [Ferruginibacter sp.]